MTVHELYAAVLSERLCLDAKRVPRGFSLTYHSIRVTVRVDSDDLGFASMDAWFGDPGIAEPDLNGVTNRVSRRCRGVSAWPDEGGDVCLRVESFVSAPGTLPSAEVLAAILVRMLVTLRNAVRVFGEGVTLARLDPESATTAAAGDMGDVGRAAGPTAGRPADDHDA